MQKKTAVINIYNFIRMSHVEPSRFIPDDFETIRNELIAVKQYGFPGTYALKYDALMEPRYQALLKEYLDEHDEVSAWWEITEPLCIRAGVPFRGHEWAEEYDDRVDSAYCIGYTPEERKRLVDAYMADFRVVFGKYPETIGSWVLDSVTLQYAAEAYGVAGGAICRDQMGTDGFTLWGGWPNGPYYPSKGNEFIPAQTAENQINVPMFRLRGPDPIYNFEADVRDGLQGVYTLEPSWVTGRDPGFITWLFTRLTDEDALGIGYAQVGQENNFLWENIQPGLIPQLQILEDLAKRKNIRVETMGTTARWFRQHYTKTPPMTFQASFDWDKDRKLSAMWYASPWYRMGLLGEEGHLRIRDLFLFDETYPSRYLNGPMKGTKSTFDALPILSPQLWGKGAADRPYIRLVDEKGQEPQGFIEYVAQNNITGSAKLSRDGKVLALLMMNPFLTLFQTAYRLRFDYLPEFTQRDEEICLCHNGFPYSFRVTAGTVRRLSDHSLEILPAVSGIICLSFCRGNMKLYEEYERFPKQIPAPEPVTGKKRPVPPIAPAADPEDSVFPWGSTQKVTLTTHDAGVIRYTLDGTEPTEQAPAYTAPLTICRNTVLKANLFLPDGRSSETAVYDYRFGLKNIALGSPTHFDPRPVFAGSGITALLQERRANRDFLCTRWRGTLEDLDVIAVLEKPMAIRSISLGFLSHHRGGIVYPESVELYTGLDPAHLEKKQTIALPCAPCPREIDKTDVEFTLNETVGAFRIVAHRYEKMPAWCCYHGAANVFTMADALIVTPEED